MDPAREGMVSVAEGTKLKVPESWTVAFHELAESYEKVERAKDYLGAHRDANSREDILRSQRPELSKYLPGGGSPLLMLSGDKLNKHRKEVTKQLKKKQ